MAIVKCHDRKRDVTYVYDSECFFDEEKGKYRYKRRLIGKVNPETGDTIPTGTRGGYHPRKEKRPQEEWVPIKPGRKRKRSLSAAEMEERQEPKEKTELEKAKETIQDLQKEAADLRKKYLSVVSDYNKLIDGLRKITPEHMEP